MELEERVGAAVAPFPPPAFMSTTPPNNIPAEVLEARAKYSSWPPPPAEVTPGTSNPNRGNPITAKVPAHKLAELYTLWAAVHRVNIAAGVNPDNLTANVLAYVNSVLAPHDWTTLEDLGPDEFYHVRATLQDALGAVG